MNSVLSHKKKREQSSITNQIQIKNPNTAETERLESNRSNTKFHEKVKKELVKNKSVRNLDQLTQKEDFKTHPLSSISRGVLKTKQSTLKTENGRTPQRMTEGKNKQ